MGQVVSAEWQYGDEEEDEETDLDHTLSLPDECLALVFSKLRSAERKPCSEVCKRWYLVEGESRQRLSIISRVEIVAKIPSIFNRFTGITKLTLRCDRRSLGIDDAALLLIASCCNRLKSLKLSSCLDITDDGVVSFVQICSSLTKFSCGSCKLGLKSIQAIVTHCKSLEEINLKRLRHYGDNAGLVLSGGRNLKRICLKELCNAQCFVPLIADSKNLKTLKLFRCTGLGENELDVMASHVKDLSELHLEKMYVTDTGLKAVSKLSNLEAFHLIKAGECSDVGIAALANGCRKIRRLHINGMRKNKIGDDGLVMVAKNCLLLKELVLVGVNATVQSLSMVASNCTILERLAFCGSETIGDIELSCIAAKCHALKKLCIKGCPVSDQGMEFLASGCPKLVKVKVKKCKGVTSEIADRLRTSKLCLSVNLEDTTTIQVSEILSQDEGSAISMFNILPSSSAISSVGNSTLSKLTLLAGGSFLACAFLKFTSTASFSM